jgi:homoaconitase/3-isopropylmalate dehydratase large subunit
VVPVTEEEGMELNGCFIGACTTTEEDLILGALVMEQAMKTITAPGDADLKSCVFVYIA